MKVILVHDATLIAEVSSIAYENHARLRDQYPWLPVKKLEDFASRIEWMIREGRVYAIEEDEAVCAFLGWFKIDDFRNLGPGALTPDWCFGVAERAAGMPAGDPENTSGSRETSHEVSRLMSPLVRRLLSDLKAEGLGIHAIGVPSASKELLEEFSLLSYGRIVLDAARPAVDLLALPCADLDGFTVRAAEIADAG